MWLFDVSCFCQISIWMSWEVCVCVCSLEEVEEKIMWSGAKLSRWVPEPSVWSRAERQVWREVRQDIFWLPINQNPNPNTLPMRLKVSPLFWGTALFLNGPGVECPVNPFQWNVLSKRQCVMATNCHRGCFYPSKKLDFWKQNSTSFEQLGVSTPALWPETANDWAGRQKTCSLFFPFPPEPRTAANCASSWHFAQFTLWICCFFT